MATTDKIGVGISPWLQREIRNADRRQAYLERKIGPHKCVAKQIGYIKRLTVLGQPDRLLKRPVMERRFVVCRICRRDMGGEHA